MQGVKIWGADEKPVRNKGRAFFIFEASIEYFDGEIIDILPAEYDQGEGTSSVRKIIGEKRPLRARWLSHPPPDDRITQMVY